MDYQQIIHNISEQIRGIPCQGEVASYIPELSKVPSNKFGVHLSTLDGEDFSFGNSDESFSIQSISKVIALTLAFNLGGNDIWTRVGVEPSGNPFNSLVQLEYEKGIPRNPFINSGALVISDLLISILEEPKKDFLHFVRSISENHSISYNHRIAKSEKRHGHRNAALVNLMKSFGNITNNVEEVLDFYYYQCSLEMTCKELAHTFLLYANRGLSPSSGEQIITASKAKRINAIMQTCGFYDQSGDFTFKVGLPGKSGVGGGIGAVNPGVYSIAVWSPPLNKKGNSVRGMQFLERLTTETKSSIF
ncbi:glutaminase [Fodinibius halophilus]|uniref:Glutaminase n=1 Tax=Fodinibius halophilus TaxID=1736908 RepID=A0A6M1T2G4_9BACT|nr:glutaminase [Fodinibius halophilus]NGP86813.1 glutaminase [Fodinibius halophilus]